MTEPAPAKTAFYEAVTQMEPVCVDLHMLPSLGEAAQVSMAISLKRIADAFDCSETGGRPQGTVLWWLEMIAGAANAGRS